MDGVTGAWRPDRTGTLKNLRPGSRISDSHHEGMTPGSAPRTSERHVEPAVPRAADLPEPEPAPVRDLVRVPGVHLRLPDDRAAGLRDDPDPLRARPEVRRAQEPEALSLELSRRGHVPRGGDEPHPRRPRARD